MGRLRGLMAEFPFIGDVRGKGLLTAFEMVADRDSFAVLDPSLNAHQRLVDLAYDRGLIVYSRRTRGGIEGDHVLVCPPLTVVPEEIDAIVSILRDSLSALADELSLPRR